MKTLLLFFLLCNMAQADSTLYPQDHPLPENACRLNNPGQMDFSGRRCVNPSAFSVTYEGYFFSDAPCFSNINQALSAVENEYACKRPSYNGYCSLVRPSQADRRNARCNNQAAWSVSYYGYFFSTTPCFSSASDAVRAMENTWACNAPPTSGQCQLVYPGEADRSNRRCVNQGAWGLAYNGYFISDAPCFQNANDAVRAMLSNPSCR